MFACKQETRCLHVNRVYNPLSTLVILKHHTIHLKKHTKKCVFLSQNNDVRPLIVFIEPDQFNPLSPENDDIGF